MDLEKLVVSLEARINQYEKSFARAVSISKRDMGKIERSAERLDARLAKMGAGAFSSFAKGALLAAAPILTATALINGAKAALAEFGDISDNAKSAGLDAEFFQGIAHGAQLAGVDMNTLSGALNTFNKNSGLAVENKGRMVTALKALNPELLTNIQAAKSQEERLRLAADAIRDTTDAAEKAALATALFGDAGFKLADAFSGGSSGIDQTIAAARELGIVVDRELIERAEQLGDEFETASKIIDLQLKQALINLAPFLVTAVQWAGEFARLMGVAADQVKAVEDRQFVRPLQNQLADVYNRRFAVGDDIKRTRAEAAPGMAALTESIINDKQAEFDRLTVEADRLLARITELQGNTSVPVVPPSMPGLPGDGDDLPDVGGSSRNRAADAAVRQAEAVCDLIASLQHEQEQLGRTAEQQELYNALKSVGVDLEPEYGQEIAAAMAALQAQRAAIEGNAEAMELLGEASEQALNTIIDGLREGKSAGEIFGNILANLGSQLASMGIAGLRNALIPGIPGREHGGPVRKGQPYIVGERRAELFVPDQNGTIVPRLPDASAARGMPGMSFPFAPIIDARGADTAGIDRLMGAMAKQHAEFEGRVKNIVRSHGRKWK